jgi:DNA-binding MarR family transcriptional regulator
MEIKHRLPVFDSILSICHKLWMRKARSTTALIVEDYRLQALFSLAGDRLVADLGLTSARWQVLAAVMMQAKPLPVVRLAEALGLARQSVQRVVDDLAAVGALAFADNPEHRRAKLVIVTPKGRTLFDAAMERQAPWARALTEGLSADTIAETTETLARLRARLERQRAR